MTFGATLGTDSPPSSTFTSGTATSIFTAGATGGTGSASATVDNQSTNITINISQPPLITSASNTTFMVGSNGLFTVTKTGLPAPGLSASGAFPNGVGINLGTGNLSGTPAVGTGGTYPLVFTATNAVGTNNQNFTLFVNQPPAITSANNKTFNAGSASNFTVTATGFPAPALHESGSLPAGIGFTNATGVLGGTPALGSGGIYPIALTATNSTGTNTQSFTLTVNQEPSVACPASLVTNASGGVCLLPSISFAATAAGFPAPVTAYRLGSNLITSPTSFPLGTNVVNVSATNSVGSNSCSFTVLVLPGLGPLLNASRSSTNVVLSWPTNFGCYSLEVASSLSSTTNWHLYTGARVTNSGSFFVTNNASVSNGFFRLAH